MREEVFMNKHLPLRTEVLETSAPLRPTVQLDVWACQWLVNDRQSLYSLRVYHSKLVASC